MHPRDETRDSNELRTAARELNRHLDHGIIPFWRDRAPDNAHGGYLVRFDGEGRSLGTPEKYLNTQCRLLWWFSALARHGRDPAANLGLARHGFEFIRRHFWDEARGGWFWKVRADGSSLDEGKVVYGQSFAIYAMAEYALASGDDEARRLAEQTFDLLRRHCADVRHGGYLENLEPDWTLSTPGFHAGDRKSLDTHMHLLEAFTVLYELTSAEGHRQKLMELAELIRARMIDPVAGCGRNQFDLSFTPIPALAIRRTWNAERQGDAPASPTDTTSYGHNLELAWLMRRALHVANEDPTSWNPVLGGLVEHAVAHGIDWQHGGVYRDGTAQGGPLVREKEFWQNAEALVGLLDGWEATGEGRYAEAFVNVWEFSRRHFIAPCGEWRVLLDRQGRAIDDHVGNNWKVCYHSGRAALECVTRLERMHGRKSDRRA
jgi:mannobiose 2-epimerase